MVFHTLDEGEARDFVLGLDDNGDIDLLLVDTVGAASGMHDAVASVSDVVLCPIQPSPSDLETAVGTANWMWRLEGRVEEPAQLPAFRALVNRVGRRPTRAEAGVLGAIRTTPLVGRGPDEPGEMLSLLPIAIQARDAYQSSPGDCAAIEFPRLPTTTAGLRRLVDMTGMGAGNSTGHGGLFYVRLLKPLMLRRPPERMTPPAPSH